VSVFWGRGWGTRSEAGPYTQEIYKPFSWDVMEV